LRLGSQSQNLNTHSPVRQVVTIPPGSQQVTLRFWVWTWSGSLTGADRQEARLFAADGSLLDTFLFSLSNNQTWQWLESDLTRFSGQTVQLLFNVYNDGLNSLAAMFLDDVSLIVCNPNIPMTTMAQVAVPSALPWPDLNHVSQPTGPVGTLRSGPTSAAVAKQPGAYDPQLTRIALPLTPVLTATPSPAWTPTTAMAATSTRGSSSASPPSQMLATWQERWWVIVVALGLLTVLALLLNWRRGASQ
jgi:hypothetical protein